jgi:N-acetylneuraminic acid mutarotase
MKIISLPIMLIILSQDIFGQSVGIGTTSPNASALLDLSSTSKGVLLPRMSTAQRNAIVAPVSGLMMINTDDLCIDIYDGVNWIKNCGFKITGTDTMPQGTWTQKQNFGGTARMGAVGFSIGDKGYIGTGWDGAAKSDFWEYNPASNVWSQKASLPIGRSYGVGIAIQSSANGIVKGYIGLGTNSPGNDWWEYTVASNSWIQKASFPGEARSHAVGFSLGFSGYVGTGITSSNAWLSNFYSYNPVIDQWTQESFTFPYPTHSAVAINVNGTILVGTGWNIAIMGFPPVFVNVVVNTFYRLQSLSSWIPAASLPGAPRQNAVAFSVGNFGYVATGSDANGVPKNDMWQYNALSMHGRNLQISPDRPGILRWVCH